MEGTEETALQINMLIVLTSETSSSISSTQPATLFTRLVMSTSRTVSVQDARARGIAVVISIAVNTYYSFGRSRLPFRYRSIC